MSKWWRPQIFSHFEEEDVEQEREESSIRILSYFQEEMIVKEDPTKLEKTMI